VIDTTGAPFASAIWKLLGGCTVILYIHYPFISTDMLHDVENRILSPNNSEKVARSKLATRLKIVYYRILCFFYGLSGRLVDHSFVNSSWTKAHIRAIYKKEPTLLYPPCDLSLESSNSRDKNLIISVGQFRPEKNHGLQLSVIELLTRATCDAKLVIVGGVRDSKDEALVEKLRGLIKEKGLIEKVELKVNIDFRELVDLERKANVGIHTMRNEHFGICVVEYIAAGLIPVAHNSGGPKEDIVRNEDYLAETAEEYCEKIKRALELSEEQRETEIRGLQNNLERFGIEAFQNQFQKEVRRFVRS
jgi:alpha-1,2-mannosyltransferase